MADAKARDGGVAAQLFVLFFELIADALAGDFDRHLLCGRTRVLNPHVVLKILILLGNARHFALSHDNLIHSISRRLKRRRVLKHAYGFALKFRTLATNHAGVYRRRTVRAAHRKDSSILCKRLIGVFPLLQNRAGRLRIIDPKAAR
jgi:hypothetical protein